MEAEKNETKKRQTAYIVSVKEILDGEYVKEAGWQPNYVITSDGKKVSRANLMGVIVHKTPKTDNYASILVDDGSGKIDIRSFEENKQIENVNIGDIVLIVGRPRAFENQKYIVPEIIKKIKNSDWVKVRQLELKKKTNGKEVKIENDAPTKAERVKEEELEEMPSDSTKIIELIKKEDTGPGVDIQDIIEKSKIKNVEKLIGSLLREGEIFEISPGKVKAL